MLRQLPPFAAPALLHPPAYYAGEGEGEGPPESQEEEVASGHSGDEEEASIASVSSPASPPPRLEPAIPQEPQREGMSPGEDSRSSGGRPVSRDSACSDGGVHGPPPTMSPAFRPSPTSSPPAALDFSTKRPPSPPALNLSKAAVAVPSPPPPNGPLDLSVGPRKRVLEDTSPRSSPGPRKAPRPEFKPVVSPWTSPVSHFPYFAAAVAAAAAANTLSPKAESHPEVWNGKTKEKSFPGPPIPTDATKALEKMSELSKLGGEEYRPGKHSAWQSHWLNKGAEQAKDVLKCVWCKRSFPSLAAMTAHMKEAKHCGVSVPSPVVAPPAPPPQPMPVTPPAPPPPKSNASDLNLLIKETMPLPRKLVRGQDVWLGKGAEQTRQILKCMWCGQSFRSLAEMTSHMQQTQHYTNIISQEQIISWKSAEEGKTNVNNNTTTPVTSGGGSNTSGGNTAGPASSHVSAVLTCKVCDQAFSSLKELSNHMVKNSHYKEHIMRSITESGSRRRQTREKRKKSLPVRKLLELERAQNELKNGESIALLSKQGRDEHSAGRITCEKCKEKIDMAVFVDHIRICVGVDNRNLLKNALLSSNMIPDTHVPQSIRKEQRLMSPPTPTDLSVNSSKESDGKGSSPSVLNAIEKLIEKSFDSRSRHGPGGFAGPGLPGQSPTGSSILKRLGIDESVDYTKPLIDAQTINLLRNYHRHDGHGFVRRERSGSESSSVSEKGRADSLTPERKFDRSLSGTPRATPESRVQTPPSSEENIKEEDIKKEPSESEELPAVIKQECPNDEEDERRSEEEKRTTERTPDPEDQEGSSRRDSPGGSPCASPLGSDRSDKKAPSGSLGALSSMFDNLPGGGGSEQGSKGSSHPLAALQKLCDKTETVPQRSSGGGGGGGGGGGPPSTSPAPPPPASPGSILAFSWACNDAVVTPDAVMKCAFCDTPFISKGAYRHHLSKMHFVKEGVVPDPVALKPSSPAPAPATTSSKQTPPSAPSKSPPQTQTSFEESPHSKFLKYTELAKQLSSKYV